MLLVEELMDWIELHDIPACKLISIHARAIDPNCTLNEMQFGLITIYEITFTDGSQYQYNFNNSNQG